MGGAPSSASGGSSFASAVGGGARIAPFAGLALAAAAEALADAGWVGVDATEAQRRRAGVSIGAGMGHVGDLTNAGRVGYQLFPTLCCCQHQLMTPSVVHVTNLTRFNR